MFVSYFILFFFFFNDTATTEIYTLSLHDALPILDDEHPDRKRNRTLGCLHPRSEEHTSELQSHSDLVCRLLLEKKKKNNTQNDKIKKKKRHTKKREKKTKK